MKKKVGLFILLYSVSIQAGERSISETRTSSIIPLKFADAAEVLHAPIQNG